MSEHDLVAHLYATTLTLAREHGQVFLPLEVVRERLGWSREVLGEVVDHCVALDPLVMHPLGLKAEWMDDGERPPFGASGQRFIGIRPVSP
jgi:hypothetical protein